MAVLSKHEIQRRLTETRDLVISPMIDAATQIEEGAVNIRLGTKFIVVRKSQSGVLDPRRLSVAEIRKFKSRFHSAIGEEVVLHPGQLLLAATLEFIRLPGNLCASVLSRSRFGRIGLLVATAIYVHPLWRGCLTLELVNSGEAPIALICGAPIGQLVLADAYPLTSGKAGTGRIHIPTEPEFVSMAHDPEWELLRRIRNRDAREQKEG